jgi:hypothetical protein
VLGNGADSPPVNFSVKRNMIKQHKSEKIKNNILLVGIFGAATTVVAFTTFILFDFLPIPDELDSST